MALFGLVIYCDKVHKDVLGWHQSYPLYLVLANVETQARLKGNEGGTLLAELPIIKPLNGDSKSPAYQCATTHMLHHSISIIFNQQFINAQHSGMECIDAAGEAYHG